MSRPAAGQKARNRRPEQTRPGQPAGATGGARRADKHTGGAAAAPEAGPLLDLEALPLGASSSEEAAGAEPAPQSGVAHTLADEARADEVRADEVASAPPADLTHGPADATDSAEAAHAADVAPAAEPPNEPTDATDSAEAANAAEAANVDEEGPPSPVNYDEEGIGEVEIDGSIYRFDSGKQGTALCLSRRREGAWRWNYLGELRWDGRDLRSKALERSLLTQLSTSLRALAEAAS